LLQGILVADLDAQGALYILFQDLVEGKHIFTLPQVFSFTQGEVLVIEMEEYKYAAFDSVPNTDDDAKSLLKNSFCVVAPIEENIVYWILDQMPEHPVIVHRAGPDRWRVCFATKGQRDSVRKAYPNNIIFVENNRHTLKIEDELFYYEMRIFTNCSKVDLGIWFDENVKDKDIRFVTEEKKSNIPTGVYNLCMSKKLSVNDVVISGLKKALIFPTNEKGQKFFELKKQKIAKERELAEARQKAATMRAVAASKSPFITAGDYLRTQQRGKTPTVLAPNTPNVSNEHVSTVSAAPGGTQSIDNRSLRRTNSKENLSTVNKAIMRGSLDDDTIIEDRIMDSDKDSTDEEQEPSDGPSKKRVKNTLG
jgi:hypothetical protein